MAMTLVNYLIPYCALQYENQNYQNIITQTNSVLMFMYSMTNGYAIKFHISIIAGEIAATPCVETIYLQAMTKRANSKTKHWTIRPKMSHASTDMSAHSQHANIGAHFRRIRKLSFLLLHTLNKYVKFYNLYVTLFADS